ncbi:MAG: hypothetical protein ACI4RO_02405 [Candidatus Scatosoma sp.]
MNIDVITLTDAQYALLTDEQIEKVRAVQTKKNTLTDKLAADMKKQKYALVRAGIFRSCVYEKACDELTAAYDKKVAALREGLLFYLQFCAKPESGGGTSEPYADYSLTLAERVQVVKNYYESKYSSASERFTAFQADKTAPSYLGEYYSAVYDYFSQGA